MLYKFKTEYLALDENEDGDISEAEMIGLLKSLKRKLSLSEKAIIKLVKDTDQNGDGKIDIDEFVSFLENGTKKDVIRKALIQRSGIRKAFEKYDIDGNGFITRNEFRRIVEDKYQSTLMPSQVDALMDQADLNKSGEIDFDEFIKAFAYFPVT